MELPTEIWEQIVNNSKKTVTEHMDSMNFYELLDTMNQIKTRMKDMIIDRKNMFSLGDIVKDTENDKLYCIDCIGRTDTSYTVLGIEIYRTDYHFTKYGYYTEINSGIYTRLDIFKLEIVQSRKEIDNLIYKYIDTLDKGDEITYIATPNHSPYTLIQTDTVIRINKDHIRILNNVRVKKEKVLIRH